MEIAVITGASSGLGIEFLRAAVTLCPEIDTYWLIARREDRLKALKPQFPKKNLRPIALDLTDSAALKQFNALLEREKPEISLLINNAGFGKLCDFATSDVESQTAMIDLNCRALTAVTRYSLPYMKTGGLILNISSIASFAPTPRMAVYCSTKVGKTKSKQGRMADALALGGDEGRDKSIKQSETRPIKEYFSFTVNPFKI